MIFGASVPLYGGGMEIIMASECTVSDQGTQNFKHTETNRTTLTSENLCFAEFHPEKIPALALSLPDEVSRYVEAGDYVQADQAILRWLERPISKSMKDRLELEQYRMVLMKEQFPDLTETALAKVQEKIPGFTREDLEQMDREGYAEWMMRDGKKYYIHNLARNLARLEKPLPNQPQETEEEKLEKETLHKEVYTIMQNRKASWRFHVKTTIKGNEECFEPGVPLTAHLPIPAQLFQTSNVQILSCSGGKAVIDRPDSLWRAVCIQNEDPQENPEFSVEYTYQTDCVYHDFSEADRAACEASFVPDPSAYTDFLGEQEPHIIFTPYLKQLARELTEGINDPLEKARRIFGYITQNVNYSYMRIYTAMLSIPDYAARNLRGDCGVQALLFITLCRICGIPARWQSGLYVIPGSVGAHDWALFYVEPYGWLFADPSFGGSACREGDETRRWFYFGNLDPFRAAANHAFMHTFAVPKKFWPVDISDNQTGELESAVKGYRRGEFETDQILISCEKLV